MSRFSISKSPLSGVKVIERLQLGDERGFLSRLFCASDLDSAGWIGPIAQLNHTFTALKGTVRGMHYQRPPNAEIKLVSCLRGAILDVAIDLRQGSPTFLKWYAEVLSSQNLRALLIPKGVAHGYQSLTDNVELLYCHSETYVQEAEAGLNPMDPQLAIRWPLPITVMSSRDSGHQLINDTYEGVVI